MIDVPSLLGLMDEAGFRFFMATKFPDGAGSGDFRSGLISFARRNRSDLISDIEVAGNRFVGGALVCRR